MSTHGHSWLTFEVVDAVAELSLDFPVTPFCVVSVVANGRAEFCWLKNVLLKETAPYKYGKQVYNTKLN